MIDNKVEAGGAFSLSQENVNRAERIRAHDVAIIQPRPTIVQSACGLPGRDRRRVSGRFGRRPQRTLPNSGTAGQSRNRARSLRAVQKLDPPSGSSEAECSRHESASRRPGRIPIHGVVRPSHDRLRQLTRCDLLCDLNPEDTFYRFPALRMCRIGSFEPSINQRSIIVATKLPISLSRAFTACALFFAPKAPC